jgi:hypothetical protein
MDTIPFSSGPAVWVGPSAVVGLAAGVGPAEVVGPGVFRRIPGLKKFL